MATTKNENELEGFVIDLSEVSPPETSGSATAPAGLSSFGVDPLAVDSRREIISPFDREIIDLDDSKSTDKLIGLLEQIKNTEKQLYAVKPLVVRELAARTEGDAKTRRVMGDDRLAKVTMPDLSWDQGILKEAWNSYPKFRDMCLKIGEITVALRDWKKIENTTGGDDFNQFRDMVKAACRGAIGSPSITIEK